MPSADTRSARQTLECVNRLAELAQQANNPEGQDWYSSGSVIWLNHLPYAELAGAVADHFGPGFTPFLVAATDDIIMLKPIPAHDATQDVDLNEEDIATLLAEIA